MSALVLCPFVSHLKRSFAKETSKYTNGFIEQANMKTQRQDVENLDMSAFLLCPFVSHLKGSFAKETSKYKHSHCKKKIANLPMAL